jgi:hypothetical protein
MEYRATHNVRNHVAVMPKITLHYPRTGINAPRSWLPPLAREADQTEYQHRPRARLVEYTECWPCSIPRPPIDKPKSLAISHHKVCNHLRQFSVSFVAGIGAIVFVRGGRACWRKNEWTPEYDCLEP